MIKSRSNFLTNEIFKKTVFIVFLLFSIQFWHLKFIPQKYNADNLLTWLFCGYCFLMVRKKSNLKFKNAIILFLIGLMINIIPAYINQGTSPYDSLLRFNFFYFILIYFMLHYFKLSIKFLEKIIIIFAILLTLIYIIQYLVFPYQIVNFQAEALEIRGTIRFRIIGHGFLILAYFLSLNRFLLNPQLKNILLALAFFIVSLMMGFRTLVTGALLVTLLMSFKIFRFHVKSFVPLFVLILLLVILFQFPGPSQILKEFITTTESNIKEGHQYVRLIEMEYYFKEYPKNISYFIIGGGLPGGGYLPGYIYGFLTDYGILWVDLGLLGFYIVYGAIALSGLLWYTLKAIFIKLPQDKLYLNFYFMYLVIVSFTNQEIYRDGIFTVQAIGLYLIDIVIEQSKSKLELSSGYHF
jgi:hypothetical protein